MKLSSALLLFVMLLGLTPFSDAQEVWVVYVNSRFGTSITYPADLFAKPITAANNDGIHFKANADGAELAIWGSFDALGQSSYEQMCSGGCAGETYKIDQPSMAVSSGVDAEKIYYQKCLKKTGYRTVFHCFRISYPRAYSAKYASIVVKLGGTLKSA